MNKPLFVCSKCGSQHVQVKQWVYLNKPEIPDLSWLSGDPDDCWCENCEDHHDIITEEEYLKLKKS